MKHDARAGVPLLKARRPGSRPPPVFPTVAAACAAHPGPDPLPLIFPAAISARAGEFVAAFPGRTLYAVKCNPEPSVLQLLFAAGVQDFDVASLAELRRVRALLPQARLHFMHPVKAREAISAAWAAGVRSFVVDTPGELSKVFEQISSPDVLVLIRLAVEAGAARYALAGKFGARPAEAARLLRSASRRTRRLGLCFHVGSQCMDPADYGRAIAVAGAVMRQAGVPVSVLDVGGGFPSRYPGMRPPPDAAYFDAICGAATAHGFGGGRLWGEPGRTLVADGGATLVRVEGRRGADLYLNDGVFGTLHDAGGPGWRFPARLVRPSRAPHREFRVFGPSCDSADVLSAPIRLPRDAHEGDWIEFGQLGAYGAALQSRFNGFAPARPALVLEAPLIDRGHRAAPER